MDKWKKSIFLITILLCTVSNTFAVNMAVNVNDTDLSSNVDVEVNQTALEKSIAESKQAIINRSFSIYKDIKTIIYDYKHVDSTKEAEIYKTNNSFDVNLVSMRENSSIALAFVGKSFIVYDTIYLNVYNNENDSKFMTVTIGKETVNYELDEVYNMYRFDLEDNVKAFKVEIKDENEEILYSTGELKVIHKRYIDWYEENEEEEVTLTTSQLYGKQLIYFFVGGGLAIFLILLWIRHEHKRKSNYIEAV